MAETREAIIRAAEELFAARGIDGVSLREINRAAQQSNTGAVQYHFGDRDGLVRAVIARHRQDSEPRRHTLLDQYEATGNEDLRALAEALVLPIAAKLADPDGGRQYLQIAGEYYCRPASLRELIPERTPGNSMERWNKLLDAVVPRETKTTLRSRAATIRFVFVELARRAAAPTRPDDRLFISHLVDLVTALLATRPSEATTRLLRQRTTDARGH
ncbi:MAG: TetR/AcrR family transcriptional regulator [Acidimicrobiales bacterium]